MKSVLLIGTGGTISGAAPDATQSLGYREGDPADREDAPGFVAGGLVGPLKARILPQCCPVSGLDAAAIQQQFLRVGQTLKAD